MQNKKSYLHFVNAVRARGGKIPHMASGGIYSTGPNGQQIVNPNGPLGNAMYGQPLLQAPTQGNMTQGGIGGALTPQNQYAAQLAPTTSFNYNPITSTAANAAIAGGANYAGNIGAEQNLAGQLQRQAMGQGPNPAQAALNQNTATNVANQAALMASQRGAAANPALIAREAAQQGAATQQQAAGQAATLQAQQQLAAQQQQAALYGQMGQQVAQEQGINTGLFGTAAQAANAQNQAAIQNYAQAQGINASIANANTQASQATTGGLLGGLAAGIGALFAEGGEVPKMADGGDLQDVMDSGTIDSSLSSVMGSSGPQSFVGKFLSGAASGTTPTFASGMGALGSAVGGKLKSAFAPTPLSIQSISGDLAGAGDALGMQTPSTLQASKGAVIGEELAAKGMKVPGKPKVAGDSLKNDNVPAMLSPGEIVLPRSVAQHPDAPRKAMAFVQAIQAKQGLKRKK